MLSVAAASNFGLAFCADQRGPLNPLQGPDSFSVSSSPLYDPIHAAGWLLAVVDGSDSCWGFDEDCWSSHAWETLVYVVHWALFLVDSNSCWCPAGPFDCCLYPWTFQPHLHWCEPCTLDPLILHPLWMLDSSAEKRRHFVCNKLLNVLFTMVILMICSPRTWW